MSRAKDTCLQCGQTREEVKREGTFCATITGYEVIETKDEWERHHWRDWSDAELKAQGIHPSLWDANRRADIYDLEWDARASLCMERGHRYFHWHPPMHLDRLSLHPPNVCTVCYETRTEAAS